MRFLIIDNLKMKYDSPIFLELFGALDPVQSNFRLTLRVECMSRLLWVVESRCISLRVVMRCAV